MIPYKYRFHGHNSLDYVYRNGQTLRSHLLNVKFSPNKKRTQPRIAVVVSKKVIKSAVKRNTIRRRVYEQVRLNLTKITSAHDVVIIVTSSEILSIPATALASQISQLLQTAKIIN